MTHTSLRITALLVAGAAALGVAAVLGVSPWWGLPLIPAVWYGLTWGGRWFHAWRLARALERDRHADLRGGRKSPAAIAVDAAVRLRRIAGGDPGFATAPPGLPDLERAVFFISNPGDDETGVLLDAAASTKASRAAIAAGLRVIHDECVAALGRPLHPLFLDAETVLPLVGLRLPRFFRRWRAEREWARLRDLFDPERAEECLGVRLLQAGMPRAAIRILTDAPNTKRRRLLRRLGRLIVVIRQSQSGDVGFRMAALGTWAPAVVLVMGRRLRELIPGMPLVTAPRRGAAALESAVRNAPRLARQLAWLAEEVPPVAPLCSEAIARILDRPEEQVRRELRDGSLLARKDPVLIPHLRGLALLAEKRPVEAACEFETALGRAGDFTPAAFALAVARRRAGDPVRGAADLRRHAHHNPRNPEVPIYLARYLADGGDRPAARRAYLSGIERFPEALQIRVAYAMDLAAWGEDRAAAEQFDQVRMKQPGDAQLALLTGRARLHAGRHGDAVEPLEQAARFLRGGERAEAQYWLLAAYREQGLHDLAKPLADELVEGLGRGQEALLDEVAEYQEERHDFTRSRRASDRARRLRGGRW